MQRNVAGQFVSFEAIDITTGARKVGDAANILPYCVIDSGAVNPLGTTTVIEWAAAKSGTGLYYMQPSQAESNGEEIMYFGISSTLNVWCRPRFCAMNPPNFGLAAFPANFSTLLINGGGQITQVADVVNKSGYTLSAAGLNSLLMRDLAAVPGATAQLMDALSLLYMVLRNQHITDSGALLDKICNDAGATIGTAAISDAANIFTKGKFA